MQSLITTELIKELLAHAHQTIKRLHHESSEGHPETDEDETQWQIANAALNFGLRVSAARLDPALAGDFTRAAIELSELDDYMGGLGYLGTTAITAYVRALGIDTPLGELAAVASPEVQRAVAEGLDPGRPKDLELLSRLVRSLDGRVSAAAREVLEESGRATWWLGRFVSDPTTQIEKDVALQASAKKWVEAVAKVGDHPAPDERLVLKAFLALPPELRSSAAEAVLHLVLTHRLNKLAAACLETEGGRRALQLLMVGDEEGRRQRRTLQELVGECSEPTRRAIADTQLLVLDQASPRQWSEWESPVRDVTDVLKVVWDPKWSIDSIMKLLLRTDIPEDTLHFSGVAECLAKTTAAGPWLERFETMLLSGFPGVPSAAHRHITAVVETAQGNELRTLVERALRAPTVEPKRWALNHLLGSYWSKEVDGSRAALADRLCADEALKQLILESHTLSIRALSALRPMLLDRAVPLKTRARLMATIGELNDELSPFFSPTRWPSLSKSDQEPPGDSAERKEARLWSPKHSGPLTASEWAVFREQRDSAPLDEEVPAFALIRVLPLKPEPVDRVFVDRIVAFVLEANAELQDRLAMPAFSGLLAFRRPEDQPVFERLMKVDDYLRGRGAEAVKALFGAPAPSQARRGDVADEW